MSHLYLERSLETAGKETAEGSDDAGEDGHEDGVDEERVDGQRRLHPQLKDKNTVVMKAFSTYVDGLTIVRNVVRVCGSVYSCGRKLGEGSHP